MKQSQITQRKTSLLLTRDVSLKDLFTPEERKGKAKQSVLVQPSKDDKPIDYDRELFKGLKYKKLGSIETADCEQVSL